MADHRGLWFAALALLSACSSAPEMGTAVDTGVDRPLDFKIGKESQTDVGCTETPNDALALAYISHLRNRLEKPVFLCSYTSKADLAAALVDNSVQLALLDPASFVTVQKVTRVILAPRFDARLGRVLAVALTLKGTGRDNPKALNGARPMFLSVDATARAIPLQALADYGVNTQSFGPELIVGNEEAGLAALRQRKGDVLILTAGARQRLCRSNDPAKPLCTDVSEAWRGRPSPPQAFVVANTMPEDDRYQLIGILIALHLENKKAFGFVSTLIPKAIALDPTEPQALIQGPR